MKKKYVVIFSVLIIVSVLIYISIPKTKEELEDTETKVNNNGFLTLMLEQDDGSYQKSTSSLWPKTGYVFNAVLSNCENGGELIWNDELKTITLKTNKSDKCYVYFDKYISPIVNSVIVTDTSTSSISVSVNASGGTNNVATYYYSINNGEFTSSTSNTYTFSGLNKETTYTIKVYVKDTNGIDSSVYTINVETENTVLLANYIKNTLYQGDGVNGLYYHDGKGSYINADQEAEDNSYRYAGADPNNYICFGSNAETCPYEYLYRIIGLFDDDNDGVYNVKLIKADYTTTAMLGENGEFDQNFSYPNNSYLGVMETIAHYAWNSNNNNSSESLTPNYIPIPINFGSNDWTTSQLNTINLNTNYWNYLGEYWQNKIIETTWHLGALEEINQDELKNLINKVKTAYKEERENIGFGNNPTEYSDEIGLIYISDFGYATSPEAWTIMIGLYDISILESNWLYMGRIREWTINSILEEGCVVALCYSGVCALPANNAGASPVRPVFYLNSNVQYVSGSGTFSDPIRIN